MLGAPAAQLTGSPPPSPYISECNAVGRPDASYRLAEDLEVWWVPASLPAGLQKGGPDGKKQHHSETAKVRGTPSVERSVRLASSDALLLQGLTMVLGSHNVVTASRIPGSAATASTWASNFRHCIPPTCAISFYVVYRRGSRLTWPYIQGSFHMQAALKPAGIWLAFVSPHIPTTAYHSLIVQPLTHANS